MEDTTINSRLVQLIDSLNLNNNSFAIAMNTHGSVIGNITGGRKGKPSFDLLEKIAKAFPAVNMDWLVRGVGEIFKLPEASNDALDPECWEILESERQRARQLQNDYDSLMQRYLALKQPKSNA